jgi:peptide subunit release factor 1 (eRF1)
MQELRAIISELASFPTSHPVVSLYLDTRWRDQHQRDRVRLFFQDRSREAVRLFGEGSDAGKAIARTLGTLSTWLDDVVNQAILPGTQGLAVFASTASDSPREYAIPEPFSQALYVDTRARIFPLLSVTSRDLPALLVSVDSHGAEILEWRLGEVLDLGAVERSIPPRHKSGGWSQRKFARNLERIIHDVWKESAEVLDQLLLQNGQLAIVLFGQENNLRGFEALLSARVRGHIIGMRPQPPDDSALVRIASEVIEEESVARDFVMVHHILRQGLSERHGTVGLEQTLIASNERRIRMLTLSSRFDASGYLCGTCSGLWRTGATGCVFCGSRTEAVPLREELSRRCLSEGGDVRIIPEGGPLETYGGVGSLLRHLTGQDRPVPRERLEVAATV